MAFFWDHHTESSGTPIIEFAPPVDNKKPKLTSLAYTPAGTAHDIIVMRAVNQVATTAAAAASATSIVLNEATFGGDTIASGDYLIVTHADGTYGVYLASALSTLTVTINALAKAVNAAADVWIMGAPGDQYHSTLKTTASTAKEWQSPSGGLGESGYDIGTFARDGLGDPLMVYSGNATAAGTLNWGSGIYVS